MTDSELFNGVESTNNSQAVYRTLVVRLVAGTMHDHRRNGRESISSLRRREFRVRVRRKLTLQSVAQRSASAPKRGGESANRRFEFEKRRQPFTRTHHEMLCVVAVCICNRDLSPLRRNR